MKADRLVAILLMLQHHGQVTARQVSDELEVSERTARRDLEALGMAGLPVYSVAGRGGGWRLIGEGRTDLSGFTKAEARALFMVAGSTNSTSVELRSALRKLTGALPDTFRSDALEASTLLMLEPGGWNGSDPAPEMLAPIESSILESRQIDLAYSDRTGSTSSRRVHPLGLVSKGHSWYLVADTSKGLRTFRVDRVASVTATDDVLVRPVDFDLAEAWSKVGDHVRSFRPEVVAYGQIRDDLVVHLQRRSHRSAEFDGPFEDDGTHGSKVGEPHELPPGWRSFRVVGWSVEETAALFAGFGGGARVVGGDDVVARLTTIAAELSTIYC